MGAVDLPPPHGCCSVSYNSPFACGCHPVVLLWAAVAMSGGHHLSTWLAAETHAPDSHPDKYRSIIQRLAPIGPVDSYRGRGWPSAHLHLRYDVALY